MKRVGNNIMSFIGNDLMQLLFLEANVKIDNQLQDGFESVGFDLIILARLEKRHQNAFDVIVEDRYHLDRDTVYKFSIPRV